MIGAAPDDAGHANSPERGTDGAAVARDDPSGPVAQVVELPALDGDDGDRNFPGPPPLSLTTRIETDRLVIRTFEPRDAEPWLEIVGDPEVRRFLPPMPPPTMELFEDGLERRLTMEREHGHALWAVVEKNTSRFVGQCGLQPVERTGPEIELAYHFAPSTWNRGYGTEAAVAVLGHGFGAVGLEQVIAIVMQGNVGSWRVAEKAGMRYVGLATYYGLEDVKKYVAERETWRAPRGG
jgi:RimJ/RimL family protein N-acetyltransferase